MKLISPYTVAEELKAKYYVDGQWSPCFPAGWKGDKPEAFAALLAIGPDPPIDKIVKALYPACIKDEECSECKRPQWCVVQVGDHESYESQPAYLCAECLREALSLAGQDARE